jgi:hypothetical protein
VGETPGDGLGEGFAHPAVGALERAPVTGDGLELITEVSFALVSR